MSDVKKKLIQVASARTMFGEAWPELVPSVKDQMLRAACARMMLGKVGRKFSDRDILGIEWFAHLPTALKGDVSDCVFDEGNMLAAWFWDAYMRNPGDTLKAVEKSRKGMSKFMSGESVNPISAAKSILLNLDPNTTAKEAACLACELAGLKLSSVGAMEKTIQRIIDLTRPNRTKTASNLSS